MSVKYPSLEAYLFEAALLRQTILTDLVPQWRAEVPEFNAFQFFMMFQAAINTN